MYGAFTGSPVASPPLTSPAGDGCQKPHLSINCLPTESGTLPIRSSPKFISCVIEPFSAQRRLHISCVRLRSILKPTRGRRRGKIGMDIRDLIVRCEATKRWRGQSYGTGECAALWPIRKPVRRWYLDLSLAPRNWTDVLVGLQESEVESPNNSVRLRVQRSRIVDLLVN